jgi:CheY-like chemotaxis protein/two-component sensor histidine kinase
MMRGGQDPGTLERGLDVISRNTRLQAQLISDLLDISRIVAGKLQLEIQPVDLRAIVAEAVETVRHEAEAKSIEIRKRLDGGVGVVAGDPARLQQIVWNLLSNAVKFTPAGGWIEVSLRLIGENAEVVVSDNGAGIRADVLPHVFDRFHQADRSITRRFGGLGLGLSIVKHLAELHGGSVRAASPGEGKGATFTISLPASVAAPSPSHAHSSHRPEPYRGVSLESIRVLVVEDEPDTREFLRRLLEDQGAAVSAAASAHEAMEMFRFAPPDILISDIGLPEVDGYDLMQRIRSSGMARGETVPAIALTAYARAEDRTRALRAGYQAHIPKPVEPGDLLVTIASFAHLIEAQRRGI